MNTQLSPRGLAELSRERAQIQAQLEHYRAIVGELQAKLHEPGDTAGLLAWLKQRLEPAAQGAQPLLVQESFLRIMSAHVQVKPSGREFLVDGNDSLLEAALRSGLSLDYGCSIGSCGKCKARIVSGEVHRTRHSDYALTAAEKNAGVVLMCCNTALTDLVVEAREAEEPAPTEEPAGEDEATSAPAPRRFTPVARPGTELSFRRVVNLPPRGLGEVAVIFTAGVAVLLLLGTGSRRRRDDEAGEDRQ